MRRTSNRYHMLQIALRGLVATALLLIILMAGLSAAIVAQGDRHEARRTDAILVMGAAQWNGDPSPVLRARLDTALALYRRGYASRILLTGGTAPGDDRAEAAVAHDYLVEQGVDPTVLLSEELGRDSLSSLRAAVSIAHKEGIKSVILVSDRYHMLRALKIARDQGLEAYGEPARGSTPTDDVTRASMVVREAWAYLAYAILGR